MRDETRRLIEQRMQRDHRLVVSFLCLPGYYRRNQYCHGGTSRNADGLP
jgi:hypothetical protein